MTELLKKRCVPCEGGVRPMVWAEASALLQQVPGWAMEGGSKITKTFTFKNFKQAISFVNKVADLAEREGHHPDIEISWNKVQLTLWTHTIGGLSQNDFIVAAKVNVL